MNKDFPVTIYLDTEGSTAYWVAEYLDLQGCIGVGKTKQEALEEAEIFKEMWLETAVESGKPIPEPRNTYTKDYSGRFNMRVSKELHRRLAIESEMQEESMNTLCERYLERGLAQDRVTITIPSIIAVDTTTESFTPITVSKDSWDGFRRAHPLRTTSERIQRGA